MSLENSAAVADTPASGQETAPAAPETSNENTSRYEGFSSPDAQEPAEANQSEPAAEATTEKTAEEPEVPEGEGADEPTKTEEPDPWEGYEEIEVDGKKLKIPSEAKEYLLRQADYTRKTQEVATRAKELDAREAQITQRHQLSENEKNAELALSQIGVKLKQFENLNWAEERAKVGDDPIARGELNTLWQEYQELSGLAQQGQQYLKDAAQQRTEHAQQETAKRHAATEAFAAKNIKGWGADLHKQIVTWGAKNGFDEATLKQAYTPEVYHALYKACMWDQSLERQQSAKPLPVTPKTPVTPTTNVSAKANVGRVFDPETASMSDYEKDWQARQKRR